MEKISLEFPYDDPKK